jgi:hypothetical protein
MPLPAPANAAPMGPSTYQPAAPDSGDRQALGPVSVPQYTVPRPYSPQRTPSYVRNSANPDNPNPADDGDAPKPAEGALIGPVGYDAQ